MPHSVVSNATLQQFKHVAFNGLRCGIEENKVWHLPRQPQAKDIRNSQSQDIRVMTLILAVFPLIIHKFAIDKRQRLSAGISKHYF